MPRSRSLAVAITLKPRAACTCVAGSGTGHVFSDKIVISASWTWCRVTLPIRAIAPPAIA